MKSCLTLLVWCSFVHLLHSTSLDASIVSEPDANIALTPGHEITLKCTAADYPEIQFSWHRRRRLTTGQIEEEEQISNKDKKFIINNGALILKSPTLNDVGDYYCRVTEMRQGMIDNEKMISIRAKPFIIDFDLPTFTGRSAVVVSGEQLKLYCTVFDEFATPGQLSIKWQMSKYDENEDMNEVQTGEDGIKVERFNETSIALIIDKVTQDHRRHYKCNATNGITDNGKVIYIRVRDKYTTIGPAVAILFELVILLGIIFFSNSRKVEPDKDLYESKVNM